MTHEILIKKVDAADLVLYYQIDCIQKHPEIPILPIHVAISEDHVCLENDISNHIRMRDYLESRVLNRKEWIGLLLSIGGMLQRSVEHFLDASCFEISLTTMFYPSDKEPDFQPGNIRYRYLPIQQDSPGDSLQAFCEEISLFLSAPAPTPRASVAGSPCREYMEGMFSQEEQDCIGGWSLANFAEGLAAIREMQEKPDQADLVKQKRPLLFPSRKMKQIFHLYTRIRSFIKIHSFWKMHFPIGTDKEGSLGFSVLLIILGIELILLILAFQILYHQTGFHHRFTPALLVSGILFCFGLLDLFLIYNKKSPFYLARDKNAKEWPREENDSDSIFRSREEKTVHLVHSEEPRRIAMITSGIPGTPEESSGLKAYILVDDFVIGRDGAKVDFKINSLSIGRTHARIIRRENVFFLEDLASKNGTYLDQRRVKKNEEVLLPEKCRIRFAEKEFYFVAN